MTSQLTIEQPSLFDVPECEIVLPGPVPDPYVGLSADRRRTLRRLETLAAGYHPVAKLPLHDEAAPVGDRRAEGRRCGSCRFRAVLPYHRTSFPKCLHPENLGADEFELVGYPRVTHGAGTDVQAWLPACRDHSYGEPRLSEDAARYVPEAVSPR